MPKTVQQIFTHPARGRRSSWKRPRATVRVPSSLRIGLGHHVPQDRQEIAVGQARGLVEEEGDRARRLVDLKESGDRAQQRAASARVATRNTRGGGDSLSSSEGVGSSQPPSASSSTADSGTAAS